jgi:CRP/FNR family transcriptional regulator, cyclic AMP receptor protein
MLEAVSPYTATERMCDEMETASDAGFARFRTVPVMATLGTADLRALWRRSVLRRYRSGEIVRSQGRAADHLPVLLAGRVAAEHLTRAGRAVVIDELVAPCVIDKVAVIDGRGHTATFTAVGPCTVAAVPARPFLDAVDGLPETRAHVFRTLAAQSRAQQSRLVLAALPRGRHRVAWWLTERLSDLPPGGAAVVKLPGGQGRLGEVLGLTRVTVNRALRDLERDGLIRSGAAGIEILDAEGLLLEA